MTEFECMDCLSIGVDTHGRCASCGSNAVAVPNARRRERSLEVVCNDKVNLLNKELECSVLTFV